MSKVTKTVCDSCKEEIELNEEHYTLLGDIILENDVSELGKRVINEGDYCKCCFRQIMNNELK